HGPLDFFDGTAELEIGGLQYSPLVNRVLTYHNVDLFSVYPGRNGEPGSISATFCDEKGRIVFRLEKNEWIGAPTNWDIRIVANRISVTSPSGREVLRIRLDPPGRIVVEWLDMRFHDAHILVSEHSYAAGRIPAYGNLVSWVFAKLQITKTTPAGACIEYLSLEQMNARISYLQGVGKSLATADGETIIGSPLGAIARAAGISIGHGTNFNLFGLGRISMPVEKMTKLVRDDPEGLVAAFKR
ncbi:hypothetical protein, partial [Pseudomonas aeruginosa]|uniref:hypothetical protein n=1 Tax=Pseudomonas aeruginosa TaxID=287 RepID=UPI0015C19006